MSSGAVILDASAVLAVVLGEQDGKEVLRQMGDAAISAANWAEVIEKAINANVDDRSLRSRFEALGARVMPVEVEHAEGAARLREATRRFGLSLADRICFALAAAHESPVLTADRAWADLDLGVEVRLIR